MSRKIRITAIANANLMWMLLRGHWTYDELVEESGLSEPTVRDYIQELRRRRVVFVADWEQDRAGRRTRPCFQMKTKDGQKDTPKPKMSGAERARRYRAKKRRKLLAGDHTPATMAPCAVPAHTS